MAARRRACPFRRPALVEHNSGYTRLTRPGRAQMKHLTTGRWLSCRAVSFMILASISVAMGADELERGRAAIGSGDYEEAHRLLLPLAEQGNTVAQNAVGVLHLEGWGIKQDYKTAMKWFSRAAAQDRPSPRREERCACRRESSAAERSARSAAGASPTEQPAR